MILDEGDRDHVAKEGVDYEGDRDGLNIHLEYLYRIDQALGLLLESNFHQAS